MKLGILAVSSLAALSLVVGCAAETPDEGVASDTQDLVTATSAYTETSRLNPLDACTQTYEAADEVDPKGTRYDCGEMGGYTFVAATYDETGIGTNIRTPNGTYGVNLYAVDGVDGKDAYFGKLAEWRGRGITSATAAAPYSGRVEPTALIMRYFTASDAAPYGSFRGKNGLLVIKLTPEAVCTFAHVSGSVANHNQIARDLADSQAFKDHVCPTETPEPIAPKGCGTLPSNTGLEVDAAVTSCSGSHSFVMQSDGNLVLYNNRTGRATWSSQTAGTYASAAIMRPNGQLNVYLDGLVPAFSTPTPGNDGASLAVQDDGNVVIYAKNGRPVWSTGTQGK